MSFGANPMSSNVGSFIEQTTKPRQSSPIAWAYLLGVSSIAVLPQNLSRVSLIFHNPIEGGVSLFVCPAIDHNGNPLAAGGAGSMLILPGSSLTFSSQAPYSFSGCGCAWNAAAISGTNNPLTIWEFPG